MFNFAIITPTEENSSQVYSCVIDSFRKITSEISSLINLKLIPLLGPNWQENLAAERQARVNMQDPEFIFKEPLRNSSSPVRLCFPREKSFYDLLDKAWKLRNQWFHNELTGSSKDALIVLNTLYEIAKLLNLNITDSLQELKFRLQEISNGKIFEKSDQDLEIQKRIQEMEVQVLALAKESSDAQMELIKAEQREEELEAQITEIQKSLNAKDIKVMQTASQFSDMEATIKKLKENLRIAQNERESAIQIAEDAKKYGKELNELILNLSKAGADKESEDNFRIPEVGRTWPYKRGSIRLTLSPRFKELYLPKSSILLSEIIGKDAISIAKDWLRVRPSGGRVFMNNSGFACTYIGEDLIYLGKIEKIYLKKILESI